MEIASTKRPSPSCCDACVASASTCARRTAGALLRQPRVELRAVGVIQPRQQLARGFRGRQVAHVHGDLAAIDSISAPSIGSMPTAFRSRCSRCRKWLRPDVASGIRPQQAGSDVARGVGPSSARYARTPASRRLERDGARIVARPRGSAEQVQAQHLLGDLLVVAEEWARRSLGDVTRRWKPFALTRSSIRKVALLVQNAARAIGLPGPGRADHQRKIWNGALRRWAARRDR